MITPCVVLLSILSLALGLIKDDLTHTHRDGRHLDIFVGADILQRVLKAEDYGRSQRYLVVATRSTHIRQLLALADVDGQVTFLRVLTDDLTGVDFFLWSDEEATTALEVVEGIGVGRPRLEGNDRAVATTLDVALPWLILEEAVGKDGFTS